MSIIFTTIHTMLEFFTSNGRVAQAFLGQEAEGSFRSNDGGTRPGRVRDAMAP